MEEEKTPKNQEKQGFEKDLQSLQSTVKRLESGELSLDESLKAFEKGVQLVRRCQEELQNAERRIEQLVQVGKKGIETRPFEPGGDSL